MSDEAIPIARRGEIEPGRSKKFSLRAGNQDVGCFVVNFRGEHHAYVNRCRHVALELDWVENRFFDEEREHVLCSTHGALYLPDTGECIVGPPCGRRLVRVPLEWRGDELWARPPDDWDGVL